jgi:hypothetical protein
VTPIEAEVLAILPECRRAREVKSNEGPEINRWLAHVNQSPGKAYCAAMVSCVVAEASARANHTLTFRRSASAMRLAEINPTLEISLTDAMALMAGGVPVIYVIDHGGGTGHTGFGYGLVGDECFRDTSGNTMPAKGDSAKDRQGQGCYERTDRRLDEVFAWLRIA